VSPALCIEIFSSVAEDLQILEWVDLRKSVYTVGFVLYRWLLLCRIRKRVNAVYIFGVRPILKY